MSVIRAQPIRFGQPAAARVRLFCLPFAGGGASAFGLWGKSLPADIEVVGLQMPGRESRIREAALTSVRSMVEAALPVIIEDSTTPFAIFGHSLGAIVAYEVVRALAAAHGPMPVQLFVSARRAPDQREQDAHIHALPDQMFLAQLQERYGALPDVILQEEELLALLLPTLRADLHAIEQYETGDTSALDVPITVYGGVDDRRPAPTELSAWERMSVHPVRVRLFAGDHFFIKTQRDAITSDISLTLDRVLAGRGAA